VQCESAAVNVLIVSLVGCFNCLAVVILLTDMFLVVGSLVQVLAHWLFHRSLIFIA
jgi:hypothetical protein